jgi:hypothetical protein
MAVSRKLAAILAADVVGFSRLAGADEAAIVVAMPCVRGSNKMNTAANTVGISVPPANPCTTRNETSIAKLSLAAHPIDAKGKNAMAAVNSQRIESICVSQPVSGIAMISAIK